MEVIKVAKVDNVRLAKLSHQFSPHASATRTPSDPSTQTAQDGSLLITPHHLIWRGPLSTPSNRTSSDHAQSTSSQPLPQPSPHQSSHLSNAPEIWIALSLLAAVEHLPAYRQPTILIRLATFVTYTLSFSSPNELDDVWDSIKALISSRKPGEKDSLYAFVHGAASIPSSLPPNQLPSLPGWHCYDPQEEFSRMKVLGSKDSESTAWRLTTINNSFNFCSTYPSLLLVPAKISDTTLTYAVKYRSKGRLPVGTYVHWANGSSITRSSQPMVGFKNARSIQDEKLIEAIFHSHALHTGPRPPPNPPSTLSTTANPSQQVVYGATSSNLIIDARPTTNAMANTVKGAGTENMEYYKGCRKAYLGIDNIHVMRDSLNKVVTALQESFLTGNPVSVDALKRSGWLKHIGAILEGTSLITRTVHISNSHVLIHCSDGWDRTSQLSALSQVCLDPYYRSFAGFAVLVEKDWLSFGHKFSHRSGIVIPGRERVTFGDSPTYSNHSANGTAGNEDCEVNNSSSGAWVTSFQKQLNFGGSVGHSAAYKETSPVFHQFLDCVYQLQRQFPKRFEFNSTYLERLHEELHAGNYGTFLFDCEKERIEAKASTLTRSVWELLSPPHDVEQYRNREYDASLDDPQDRSNVDQGILFPDVKDVVFWWELFGCEDEAMNPPKVSDPQPINDFTHVGPPTCQDGAEGAETAESVTLERSGSPASLVVRKAPRHSVDRPPPGSDSSLQKASWSDSDTLDGTTFNNSYDHHQSHSTLAGEQLQNAFQTAKTMGWSTWDRLKKGYEEVSRGSPSSYQASPRARPPATSSSFSSPRQDVCTPGSRTSVFSQQQQPQYPLLSDANPWSTSEAEDLCPARADQFGSDEPSSPSRRKDSAASSLISDPWQAVGGPSEAHVPSDPPLYTSAGNPRSSLSHVAAKKPLSNPVVGYLHQSPVSQASEHEKVAAAKFTINAADVDPLGVGLT